MSCVNPYLAPNFVFFTSLHKSCFFMKQLGSCIGYDEFHAIFFLNLFDSSKYV
jgi:hypothetical protein